MAFTPRDLRIESWMIFKDLCTLGGIADNKDMREVLRVVIVELVVHTETTDIVFFSADLTAVERSQRELGCFREAVHFFLRRKDTVPHRSWGDE